MSDRDVFGIVCDKIWPVNQTKDKRLEVAVGLSGGVDSAVSAYLLKQQGYEVVGVYLKCWDEGPECQARQDRKDALRVAMKLEIPVKVLDFEKEYRERVIDRFYEAYKKGFTPNPDVWCNSEIKFGLFLDWAKSEGFDKIGTGHYAKKGETDGGYKLLRPKDKSKDQTYFLYQLNQEQLKSALFPLGEKEKSWVREKAGEIDLPVADKKDSQGICFVGDVDVQEFLRRRLEEEKGEVVNSKGERIGVHQGVWFYTIGQRGGWQIDREFQQNYQGEMPVFYVVDKDIESNKLIVGEREELGTTNFKVSDLSWIRELNDELSDDDLKVRIRNLGELVDCSVSVADELAVEVEDELEGVACGQAAVFYLNDECLGGGVIK